MERDAVVAVLSVVTDFLIYSTMIAQAVPTVSGLLVVVGPLRL